MHEKGWYTHMSQSTDVIVCKFGGTSLANAEQFRKVRDIILSDRNRRYIVVSAPGKRHSKDRKITDLLLHCHKHMEQDLDTQEIRTIIFERYRHIVTELGLNFNIDGCLDEVWMQIVHNKSEDFTASRGEYITARIMAEYLSFEFIDAADLLFFDADQRLQESTTYARVFQSLQSVERAVIPGFYGTSANGMVKTLTRGGSDITGACIARAVKARVYENWKDVSGLLMADPRIVQNPKEIRVVTYKELRELSYMGAEVLHQDATFPVRTVGIPINILNTNNPSDTGTMIVSDAIAEPGKITGIAGKKDFTVITIEKALMNQEKGFTRRLANVFEVNEVNIEHLPTGIDSISVVVAQSEITGKLSKVLHEVEQECKPDSIGVRSDLALIATVGRGMMHAPEVPAKLFGALGKEKISVRMIDQGSSGLNIIVGVDVTDFENAVRAIYNAFC